MAHAGPAARAAAPPEPTRSGVAGQRRLCGDGARGEQHAVAASRPCAEKPLYTTGGWISHRDGLPPNRELSAFGLQNKKAICGFSTGANSTKRLQKLDRPLWGAHQGIHRESIPTPTPQAQAQGPVCDARSRTRSYTLYVPLVRMPSVFVNIHTCVSLPRSRRDEAGQSPKPLRDSGIGPDSRAQVRPKGAPRDASALFVSSLPVVPGAALPFAVD